MKQYCNVCGAAFSESHNVPNLELDLEVKVPALKVLRPDISEKLKAKLFRRAIQIKSRRCGTRFFEYEVKENIELGKIDGGAVRVVEI